MACERERFAARRILAILAALLALVLLANTGQCGITELVSVSSTGEPANYEVLGVDISADGRYAVFPTEADNLVPGDTNNVVDVFVRDRATRTTERVSVSSTGAQGNGDSRGGPISADGRFVAFESEATNLVPGDTNNVWDVFIRDRLTGTTERVSVSSTGQQGNADSVGGSLSADGRFVAFYSGASNLVPGDTNWSDIFVRDRLSGTTQRVSVSNAGEQANSSSLYASISADGRCVAFVSEASNLVPGDTNGRLDIFVRDRLTGTTERVNVSSSGEQSNTTSDDSGSSMSGDGRFVAFCSDATNLVPDDTNRQRDVFVRDRLNGTTERVSIGSAGEQANRGSIAPAISGDGRYVAFCSGATNLLPGDTNNAMDMFVRDRQTGTLELVSVSSAGEQANGHSYPGPITPGGRFVAFVSEATNLVPGPSGSAIAAYVRDREGTAPPAFSINGGAACTDSAQVTLSITCGQWAEVRFRNDPGDWSLWEPCTAAKPWTLTSGEGTKRVYVQGRDAQLRESVEGWDEIRFDTTTVPPTNLSISINSGAPCTDSAEVQLTLSAEGAAEMRFSNDGQDWSAWQPYASGKGWSLAQPRGTATVWFQCRDGCERESATVSDTIWRVAFDDVLCSHSQRPYIEALSQQAIVPGCSADPPRYCPYGPVSRALIAEALCKAAGKTWLDRATPTFADVPETHPAYGWIERLADAPSWGGTPVTDGCGRQGVQRLFCPDADVTRQQAAKLLCRATGRAPMPTCAGVFADVPSARPPCPYVERLADPTSWPGGAAVTNGCANWRGRRWYCPDSPLKRGQMAVFIVRAFGIPL